MSLVPPPFVVKKEDPFDGDAFGREETVKKLSSLVLAEQGPMVMTVSAPWGQGKTVFCQQWQAYLEKEHGTRTIWFNAWEEDHAEDPLLSLLACFRAAVKAAEAEHEKLTGGAEISGKVDAAIVSVLMTSGEVAVNYATAGGMDLIKQGIQRHKDAAAEADPDRWVNRALEAHDERQDVLRRFKEALTAFAALRKGPLVVVVDELDRCRPAYAVGLLEKIKHLFAVKGVTFVLAVDEEQLGEAASALLGFTKARSQTYLEKFIHRNLNLPRGRPSAMLRRRLPAHLTQQGRNLNGSDYDFVNVVDFFCGSLRQAEATLTHVSMLETLAAARGSDLPSPLAGDLALVKTVWPGHWAALNRGGDLWEVVDEVLKEAAAGGHDKYDARTIAAFAGRLAATCDGNKLRDVIAQHVSLSEGVLLEYDNPDWSSVMSGPIDQLKAAHSGYGVGRGALRQYGVEKLNLRPLLDDMEFIGAFHAYNAA